MRDGGLRWTLVVATGGDTLRQERLTRDLHDSLRRVDGLDVGFHDAEIPAEPGSKGSGVGELTLWAAGSAAVARPVSQVLITLIREWCAKERHRKVVVTVAGESVEITGRPDAAQERLIREFRERASGDAAFRDGALRERASRDGGPRERASEDAAFGDRAAGEDGHGPQDGAA